MHSALDYLSPVDYEARTEGSQQRLRQRKECVCQSGATPRRGLYHRPARRPSAMPGLGQAGRRAPGPTELRARQGHRTPRALPGEPEEELRRPHTALARRTHPGPQGRSLHEAAEGRSGRAKSDSPIGDTAPRQPTEEEHHQCHDAHAVTTRPPSRPRSPWRRSRAKQPIIEIAERFDVHPNVITKWKRQLLEGAPGVFGAVESDKPDATGRRQAARQDRRADDGERFFVRGARARGRHRAQGDDRQRRILCPSAARRACSALPARASTTGRWPPPSATSP